MPRRVSHDFTCVPQTLLLSEAGGFISRNAGRTARWIGTKWLASSHLYYRRIKLIFKVRPVMGFSSSSTAAAAWKGKGHFHANPPSYLPTSPIFLVTYNQSASIFFPPSSLLSVSRVFVSSRSIVTRSIRKRRSHQAWRSEKKNGISVLIVSETSVLWVLIKNWYSFQWRKMLMKKEKGKNVNVIIQSERMNIIISIAKTLAY